MSKSKGQQSSAYRGHGEEVGGSSSAAAIPLPVQDELCRSGEVLPEYRDGVGRSKQSVGGEDGEGVRGVGRGETEGGVDTDAPPEFEVYVPKMKRIKSVRTGETLIISHDEHLNTDGEALYRWLLEQRSRPPSVCIRIWGTHRGGRKGRELVTDFDLYCDLTHLLLEQNHIGEPTLATVPPNQRAHRGHGRFKSIAKDLEEGRTVRDWADQYCEDQSALKEFLMKKVVVGHDRAYLKRQIRECVRSTGYAHNLSVRFLIHNKRVKVYPANRISKLRKIEWLRWIFYITSLWIFAWPYLWFITKRYHVATMTWRMSRLVRDEGGGTRRECVLTEEEWMHRWGLAIKRAVRARERGLVSQWGGI